MPRYRRLVDAAEFAGVQVFQVILLDYGLASMHIDRFEIQVSVQSAAILFYVISDQHRLLLVRAHLP